MSSPDYILDIQGLGDPSGASTAGPSHTGGAEKRPWIAVHWRCCSVYTRVYRNGAGTLYEGRCPSCARPVRVRVGPGGSSSRFFEAS